MPASIPITTTEKNWFVKLVQEVYSIHLVDAYACQRLSEELAIRARISISCNTLRRLFGIIKVNNQASRYTLDSLSRGLGYMDFIDFQKAVEQLELDYLNELLILSRFKEQNNDEVILSIIANLRFQKLDEVYLLKSIVDLCIETENYNLLYRIFYIDFNLSSQAIIDKLFVAFQSIYVFSKNGNIRVIDFIEQILPTNELAQRVILQLFVDEECLVGYYGRWILAVSEHLVPDMALFKSLMLIQQAFLLDDRDRAIDLLEKAHVLYNAMPYIAHSILKGRLAAWNLILLGDKVLAQKLFGGLQKIDDQLYFIVFFYRLQVDFKQDITRSDLIEQVDLSVNNVIFSYQWKQNLNIFYLLEAMYAKLKNNYRAQNIALQHFNPLYKYACLYDWADKQFKLLTSN
ncbi:hypothetical protein V7S78_09415 [Aquirufa regiilacus]